MRGFIEWSVGGTHEPLAAAMKSALRSIASIGDVRGDKDAWTLLVLSLKCLMALLSASARNAPVWKPLSNSASVVGFPCALSGLPCSTSSPSWEDGVFHVAQILVVMVPFVADVPLR